MTIEQARARVGDGAAMLDQKRPGWARQIDVGRLDLSHGCRCILGQQSDGFSWATRALFGVTEPAEAYKEHEAHGFTTIPDERTRLENYTLLQDAWIEAIADRLLASPVETPIAQDEEKNDEVHFHKS